MKATEYPLGDGTNGRRGQAGKCAAAGGADERSKIARLLRLPDCPKAMRMPAMMKEAMNCNNPPPMLATMPRAVFASSPILGCMLCTSAGRSAWAFDHTS